MMIEPTSLSELLAPREAPAAKGDKTVMGKDDFLQLLVAQMRHQDPLSPMDGAEYATQLAQFSSVEQLIEISRQMGAQATAAQEAQKLGMTNYATSMVGRDIVLDGARTVVGQDGTARMIIDLPDDVEQLEISVIGADGKAMASSIHAAPGSGRKSFEITVPEGVQPGSYEYIATAKDGEGNTLLTRPLTIATVEGMSIVNGEIMLRLGGTLVPFSDIVEVRAAAQPTVPAPASTNNGGSES